MRRSAALFWLMAVGCASPPAASTVLAPLQHAATRLTNFPERTETFRRVAWEFDSRSITAHYRCDDARTTAWVSRFVCEPEEQDPFAYVEAHNLLAGILEAEPDIVEHGRAREPFGSHTFQVVTFQSLAGNERTEGIIAGTLLGPRSGKYQVLIVRATGGGNGPCNSSLIRPLIEAILD